jgi:hypothetical protein
MDKVIAPRVGCEECIEVLLTPTKYPIAYKNKVDELMEQKAFDSREEAEHWVQTTPICMEFIYEKHSGLFAVESEAIEENACTSPYSGLDVVSEDDIEEEVLD